MTFFLFNCLFFTSIFVNTIYFRKEVNCVNEVDLSSVVQRVAVVETLNLIETKFALCSWRSHGTKTAILERKLRTLTYKTKKKISCFVLDVPVRTLLSRMTVFVPCDRQLQRAHLVSIRFKVPTTATRSTDDQSTSLMQLTSAQKHIVLTNMLVKSSENERGKSSSHLSRQ